MLAVMPSLSSVSIEFLLKEYEQLWLQLRDMYNYLLKVYGFYITVLGAAIAGTVTLLHTETGVQSPLSLPTFFVVASIGVLVILAATLMLHVAKLRSVATEYLNALNRIRRGFCELDQPVDTYLNLDAKDFTGSKWRNIDFYSYASVALLSGLLLAALDLRHDADRAIAWIRSTLDRLNAWMNEHVGLTTRTPGATPRTRRPGD